MLLAKPLSALIEEMYQIKWPISVWFSVNYTSTRRLLLCHHTTWFMLANFLEITEGCCPKHSRSSFSFSFSAFRVVHLMHCNGWPLFMRRNKQREARSWWCNPLLQSLGTEMEEPVDAASSSLPLEPERLMEMGLIKTPYTPTHPRSWGIANWLSLAFSQWDAPPVLPFVMSSFVFFPSVSFASLLMFCWGFFSLSFFLLVCASRVSAKWVNWTLISCNNQKPWEIPHAQICF